MEILTDAEFEKTALGDNLGIPYYISNAQLVYNAVDIAIILRIRLYQAKGLMDDGSLPYKTLNGENWVTHRNLIVFLNNGRQEINGENDINPNYYIREARLAYRVIDLVGILHISKQSIHKLIKDGTLPSKKIGGSRLIEHSNLMKFLKED